MPETRPPNTCIFFFNLFNFPKNQPEMGACTSVVHQSRKQIVRLLKLLKATTNGKEEQHSAAEENAAAAAESLDQAMDGEEQSADKVAKPKRREQVPRLELSEALVAEYLSLEKTILRLEQLEVLRRFEAKSQQADDMAKALAQLEATHKELKKQTDKEKTDLDSLEQPSIKGFLQQQGTFQARHEKQQREHASALGKQEANEKELKMARARHEHWHNVLELQREQSDRLARMHQRQDEILWAIFGSDSWGQQELETALEWQQRISMAKFKWLNGRALLVHASTQMAFGISRWKELDQIEPGNARMRYFAAAEARNNFIAAAQNVQSCRVYLGRIKFPYATEEEMLAMETAVQNSFNDIQSNLALKRALTISQGIHRKVHSLLQWFDKVINETILKDLDKAVGNVIKRQRLVRESRLELLRKAVQERLGKQLEMPQAAGHEEEEMDELEEKLVALEAEKQPKEENGEEDGTAAQQVESDHTTKNMPPASEVVDDDVSEDEDEGSNPPLPLDQLAPTPSKEALFGDVQQQLSQWGQIRADVQRRNELRRERQRLALQEKLRLRRQNRQRQMVAAQNQHPQHQRKSSRGRASIVPMPLPSTSRASLGESSEVAEEAEPGTGTSSSTAADGSNSSNASSRRSRRNERRRRWSQKYY